VTGRGLREAVKAEAAIDAAEADDSRRGARPVRRPRPEPTPASA